MSSNIAENKSKLDATAFRQIHSTKKLHRYFQIEISTKINMQIDINFFFYNDDFILVFRFLYIVVRHKL